MSRELQFIERLREAGERVTTPRLGIFRILSRQAPMPMAALIGRGQADGIDPVTIYRTVDLFRRLGFIQEVGLGRNRLLELNDGYQAHHHHFLCLSCGAIVDFDSDGVEGELARAAERWGFEIQSHQLEATGICAACGLFKSAC
jgi:Fur family transcriptional regulator, ferric uptake regulator